MERDSKSTPNETIVSRPDFCHVGVLFNESHYKHNDYINSCERKQCPHPGAVEHIHISTESGNVGAMSALHESSVYYVLVRVEHWMTLQIILKYFRYLEQ